MKLNHESAVVLSLLVIVAIVALGIATYNWVVVLNGHDSKEEKEYTEKVFKRLHDKQRTENFKEFKKLCGK